jgi:hypothetical protein
MMKAAEKCCSRCGDVKAMDQFGLHKGKPHTYCKACRRLECAEWRARNKGYRAAYYAKNAAAENSRPRPDKKAYCERNRETINQRSLAWAKANPGKAAARAMRRIATAKRATPLWASKERIDAVYALAARLTRETGVSHHVDHIVPLTSRLVCGLHVEWNLQVLPARENLEKSNRSWPQKP